MDAIDHAMALERYATFRPTAMDPAGLALGDRQQWLVVPVSRTRDSGPLDESNFTSALALLGGESEHVEVHCFGHWGPGWFEIMLVDPDAPDALLTKLGEIVCALAHYSVLDDSDFHEREEEVAEAAWSWMSLRERIRLCAKHGVSIFAARRDSYPHDDSGTIRYILTE